MQGLQESLTCILVYQYIYLSVCSRISRGYWSVLVSYMHIMPLRSYMCFLDGDFEVASSVKRTRNCDESQRTPAKPLKSVST